MSIIAEALKKAQESYKKKEACTEKIAQEQKGLAPARRKSLFLLPLITVILIFLSFGALFYFSRQNLTSQNPKPLAPPPRGEKPVAIKAEATQPSHEIQPVVHPDVTEVIKLNGIMYTPKKPLAVINGAIRGEGDYVGEFKILEIGNDFVKVGLADDEFVLRLRR